MLTAIKDWLGFGGRDTAHGDGHDHDGGAGGHGHTHGVIDPSLSSSERGIWAIKWSFVILAITAILQLIVVFMSGSVALLADTIHNIGDATTAIPLWIAFVLVRRKPTATFNYGLGRVEDLAGMVIVLIILFSAIVAAWEAIDRLMNPQPITQLLAVAVAGVVSSLLRLFSAQAFAGEIDAVGVVHEPVEDGVGIGRVADHLMPGRDGKLAGDDGGAAPIAVLEDFQQIVTGLIFERLQAPIIKDQQLNAAELAREPRVAAIAAGERQIGEQARHTLIEDGAIVAAGFVAERAGKPALSHP